jgi:hypothetical protein
MCSTVQELWEVIETEDIVHNDDDHRTGHDRRRSHCSGVRWQLPHVPSAKWVHQSQTFYSWVGQTLVAEIEQGRGETHHYSPGLLIPDGCNPHDGDFCPDLCMELPIIPFLVPAHSSNQVRPLVVWVFWSSKRLMIRLNKSVFFCSLYYENHNMLNQNTSFDGRQIQESSRGRGHNSSVHPGRGKCLEKRPPRQLDAPQDLPAQ